MKNTLKNSHRFNPLNGFAERKTSAKCYPTGFTIIELLVVVAIVAVLASIVLASVAPYRNKAKNTAVKANMDTIAKRAAIHYATNGNYNNFLLNDGSSPGFSVPISQVVKNNGNGSADSSTVNCEWLSGGSDNIGFGGIKCRCKDNDSSCLGWCVCSLLNTASDTPSNSTYCVDSTGYKKVTQNHCENRCKNLGSGFPIGSCKD